MSCPRLPAPFIRLHRDGGLGLAVVLVALARTALAAPSDNPQPHAGQPGATVAADENSTTSSSSAERSPPVAPPSPTAAEGTLAVSQGGMPRPPDPLPSDFDSAPAFARVRLRDGTALRGIIVQATPGVAIVIRASGATDMREILWADLAAIEPDAASPAMTPRPSDTAPKATGRGPQVHIETTRPRRPVTLYEIVAETPMRAQDSSLYGVLINPVCKAPCDTHIAPTLGRSFLLATGIDTRWTASRRMTLPEDSEAIYIRVHPGNKALRIAGAVLIAVGSATVVAGSLWAFPKDTRVAGLATMGVGALPVVAGIPMTLLGRTRWRFAAAPH